MRMPLMIMRKRDGHELKANHIQQFVEDVVADDVPHEQIGAMLMAIYLKGM